MKFSRFLWLFAFLALVGCQDPKVEEAPTNIGGVGGTILLPSCDDGMQNGNETGVDCGGSCGPCEDGESCRTDADCLSSCVNGICAAPSCVDACTTATRRTSTAVARPVGPAGTGCAARWPAIA